MTSEAPQDPSDRLIDQLASHLEPVRPIAGIPRMLAALASVIAVVAVAAFAGYGLRQDFWSGFVGNVTYASVLVGLVLAVVGACTATLASVIPGRETLVRVGAGVAGVGLGLAILVAVGSTPWATARFDAPLSQMTCILRGTVFATLPALALLALAARGWSARPEWTVGLGLLGTGAAGALIVHLTCPAIESLHVLCTHTSTPLLIAGALTAVLAPLMRHLAR